MTKAELEKEAEEYADRHAIIHTKDVYIEIQEAYLEGAEPREKQIAELGERCLQLQKDKGNLTDRVRELEAQIEKMKVCSNCKHFNNLDDLEYCQNCERQLVNSLDKLPREEIIKDEWQLRR